MAHPSSHTSAHASRHPFHAAMNAAQQEAANLLESRLAQLQALTILLHGDGFQVFSNLSGAYQENILWLVADMVKDCSQQVRTVLWRKKRNNESNCLMHVKSKT